MKLRVFFLIALLTLAGGVTTSTRIARADSSCAGHVGSTALKGSIDGASYIIEVPANWNGTLLLYSHGYRFPGSTNPAQDAGDPLTGATLLSQGYALAGSSYSQEGWALQQAFHDQIALLDYFNQACGQPTRTIAWGHSLGGIITAGLVQLYPDRFDAALPMCGVLSGGIGVWNQALDGAFAFDVLLANGTMPIVHITNPGAAFAQSLSILNTAQQTPQGRARIALMAALSDIPGWFNALSPEPAANDFATQEQNQFLWESQVDFAFAFFGRAELEARAGGNPSWNTGVNYRVQLAHSLFHQEVEVLYQQAGLDLNKDLNALEHAPRIAADPAAVNYLAQYITFNGELHIPVLALHTSGDGLVMPQNEQAYQSVVHAEGNAKWLRQVYVHRAGHCSFTPAETLAAFQALINRLHGHDWGNSTDPSLLNQEAAALGPGLNVFTGPTGLVPTAPAFFRYEPGGTFLRPFDIRNLSR